MGILIGVGIGTALALIGIFVMWAFFSNKQPKIKTWRARVYELGQGVWNPTNKKGEELSSLQLKDMRLKCIDTIVRRLDKNGMTRYYLKRENKTVQEVTEEYVEKYSIDKKIIKEVNVLISEGQATLIKKGYDNETGSEIFVPMPRDRMETMISEISQKNKELETKDGDLWKQIFGFGSIVLFVICIIATAYMMGDSWVKTREMDQEQEDKRMEFEKQQMEQMKYISENMEDIYRMALTKQIEEKKTIEEMKKHINGNANNSIKSIE